MSDEEPPSLYRRVLGDKFAALHPLLQRFHSLARGEGNGVFRVTRASGLLRNLLANLMGLPKAGDQVPVHLRVVAEGQGERWERTFGNRSFVTFQSARDGLLLEAARPICFGLRLEVIDGGISLVTSRVWLLGIPFPPWGAPRVQASVVPDEEGWTASVRMHLPVLGEMVRYEGHITPL